jgi:2-succinyl-5-enolpyruvyl-6-hydroxy-3-cyclohexene-1-carboxylate synthase
MNLQPVFDIAEICARKGIKKAIICPGSRNAPLTLAFARHPKIECFSVPDERSAGFIGMGMALKSNSPVVLICTSGSAAYNFAPAVAEAFFSQTPLIVLTADRPIEWIGQLDGQTIFQDNIFGRHVKASTNFPTEYNLEESIWHCHRLVNEFCNKAVEYPAGPVHINVPMREPFYPEKDEKISYSSEIKITNLEFFNSNFSEFHNENLYDFKRVLIVAGQDKLDLELAKLLSEISENFHIPVVGDIISNMSHVKNLVSTQDIFLKNKENYSALTPDLIISFGKSVISKNLKVFLRKTKSKNHWHIQSSGDVADTYQCLSKIIRCSPLDYFRYFFQTKKMDLRKNYYDLWLKKNKETQLRLESHIETSEEFSEFKVYKHLLDSLPNNIDLHLANSMSVRYANIIGLKQIRDIEVFANRGTSGIDGSVSTAIGAALATDREVYLLIGDMAFFYDRNAFWHNHLPHNLKIILFNNHGGGIFGMIDGPSRQPELQEFFVTAQKLTAEHLVKEFELGYKLCTNIFELNNGINELMKPNKKPFILEIETLMDVNKRVYKQMI